MFLEIADLTDGLGVLQDILSVSVLLFLQTLVVRRT